MRKSLWFKFLLLLFIVALVGLSATFLLRELMLKDFREYREGEMLDRIYQLMAALESSYVSDAGWEEESIIGNTVWGFMLGLEIRLYDENGNFIMDTEKALNAIAPLAKKRIMAATELQVKGDSFIPYNLFLGGVEIGRLEVTFSIPRKEIVYIRRSDTLLFLSVIVLGGIALLLSVLFSRRMIKPIKELTSAAADVSEGDLTRRVPISGADEMGKLARTFNRMAETLLIQESLRKKLTSNIAHELRTPLSVMRGEIEGMMDGYIPTDKNTLQSLYAEIGRLKTILEGIEELSQAEASGLALGRRSLELKSFLNNVMERFGKSYLNKGVSLSVECATGLSISADPDKLSQIVINLLSNALKATEKGDAVLVRAFRSGSEVKIEVTDTGRGIKEADLPFIFERFYRAEQDGLGIGLTIVKELVEAHSGKIEARSESGEGSTFTLSLPV